jgi:hypothetical protein
MSTKKCSDCGKDGGYARTFHNGAILCRECNYELTRLRCLLETGGYEVVKVISNDKVIYNEGGKNDV